MEVIISLSITIYLNSAQQCFVPEFRYFAGLGRTNSVGEMQPQVPTTASHRSCGGRLSEGDPKFFVGLYESITREASIKATGVGKKAGHGPGKLSWEATPVDV